MFSVLHSQIIVYSLGLFLFSPSLSTSRLCVCNAFITSPQLFQSGSQLSVNQEPGDPLTATSPPVQQTVTEPTLNSAADPLRPSSFTTPSCTPLPFELHIDEDGCSARTSLLASAVVIESSESHQYLKIQQKDDGSTVTSEISQVESVSVSSTVKQPSPTEINSLTHTSTPKESISPDISAQSPSPVVSNSHVSNGTSPTVGAKSPSPSDIRPKSPGPKRFSPVIISNTSDAVRKCDSPVTVPRLSSPIPKSGSPVTVPIIFSSPSEGKSSSPVPGPRLSSPVPRVASPIPIPNIASSPTVKKRSSPETGPKSISPGILPRLSSPVLKNEYTAPKSPAAIIRKTYTIPSGSSPRASPVPTVSATSSSLYTCPAESHTGQGLDLTWPCREPLVDDALEKLLSPDSTRLGESHQPASGIPREEDRSWEEEDVIDPDLSREGTLTPMTESSWIDECYTPSTCPGTPDATLDLPTQQPSAVERLSASGQVGGSNQLSQNKLVASSWRSLPSWSY